jgi:RNA-directed DNA polymerase
MENTTDCDKYSQLQLEDYLREDRLETDDNAEVYSKPTMFKTERDGARVGEENPKVGIPSNREEGLLEMILRPDNLNLAYRRVKKNKGSHGVDGMTVEELLPYLTEHGDELRESILTGKYKPQPVRRVEIPKPDGGIRLLGIPTAVDRVIQQATAQILSPIYEKKFSDSSYGFRLGRSAQQAIEQSRKYINEGYTWTVDIDLAKYFDTVNHDKLIRLISNDVKDGRVISLIRKFLVSGVMINGVVIETEEGTPQGGNISPLLSNIMLHELDCELEKRGLLFCRYADDCNVYVKSRKAAERVMKSITRFIEGDLKLTVNQQKSTVDRPWKLKFLGFSFYYNANKSSYCIRVHPKSIVKFKAKLKKLTGRSNGMSMDLRLEKLKQSIQGWVNYFGLADMKTLAKGLDEWLRRRLRMVIWKTWKRVRTRFKCLQRLRLDKQKAWEYANTRKGYWRISSSPILHRTLTNEILSKRGLVSISVIYSKR